MEIRSCMISDQIVLHSVQLPSCIAQILSQVLILCGGGGFIFVVFGGRGEVCVLGFVGGKSKSILEYKTILSGMFTNIVARWPGSTHDSHVFHTSSLCTYLETNNHSLDDGILLGDSGYACTPYLMTPYPSPSTAAQENYNTAHTKTRVIVEQSFGRWKRRFHVLHSEIRMTPQRACSVIGACAVLHNIAVLLNEPMDDDPLDDDPEGIDPYHGPQRGLAMRDHICNTYFA